jgi:hypothetical protein
VGHEPEDLQRVVEREVRDLRGRGLDYREVLREQRPPKSRVGPIARYRNIVRISHSRIVIDVAIRIREAERARSGHLARREAEECDQVERGLDLFRCQVANSPCCVNGFLVGARVDRETGQPLEHPGRELVMLVSPMRQASQRWWPTSASSNGRARAAFQVMAQTRPGGIVCLTGASPAGRSIRLDAGALNRELVLENNVVFGWVSVNRRHYELAAGRSPVPRGWLERLVTRRVPLAQWQSTLRRRDDDIKVAIEFARC